MTTPTTPDKPQTKRATMSRELGEFLIELSIALNKHAMYPGGHPSLAPAAAGVARKLADLLAGRGRLSLGVARHQLIIEGIATDPRNPVLADLADRLHRHHLGAVSFSQGVGGQELEGALKTLALDADRGADPIGLKPRAEIPRWEHIELYPLTFERLELLGGGDEGEGGGDAGTTGGRGALLWVGLARAAMAADDVDRPQRAATPPPEPHAFRLTDVKDRKKEAAGAAAAPPPAPPPGHAEAEPAAVARAIEEHERGTAYDQVIVGYLLQIADELKTAGGAEQAALKKKMSRLITTLDQGTLARLVDMGGDVRQRRQFVLNASQGMAVDAVVELVQAASGPGAPVSGAMLRMLRKLSRHADHGAAKGRAIADTGLRDQVSELVQGWALADPNPDGYAAALQKIATAEPVLVVADDAAFAPEPDRIIRMALETGAAGDGLNRAMDQMVGENRMLDLFGMLARAPRENPAVAAVRARVLDPVVLRSALMEPTVDYQLVDALIQGLGARAAGTMLDVLDETENRQLRRALIDRLTKMPDAVQPLLAPRAADERWYVQRNTLYLAAELPGEPALDALPYHKHEDVRVRREALRVLFRQPEARSMALRAALADDDERMKRLAINSVAELGCPDAAVPLVLAVATDDALESDLRVAAVRALGVQGSRSALDALLQLTAIKRRSIVDYVVRSGPGPELLAAIAALRPYRSDARARQRLEQYAAGRDPEAAKAARMALGEDA